MRKGSPMKKHRVGIVGIGAVGTVILGMYLFGESRDLLRILCLLLIISGIIGLKMVSVE